MAGFRRIQALATAAALAAHAHSAAALDAGRDGSTFDAAMTDAPTMMMTASDGSMEGGHVPPVCPDAITSASAPIVFHRMGAIDFGPGTGMMSIGSHDAIGLDYNLLFSGTYDTQMAGRLDVNWPRALSVTAVGDPMGGYLDVTFGLHMTATLWAGGLSFPLPLDMYIIDDHTGHGRSVFTPWAYHYEGTSVLVNVSAWRDIYQTTVDVAGHGIEVHLQMRYNMTASIRTVEIGFPDPSAPATMMRNLATITDTMPVAMLPAPPDGTLDLLTRWKPQLQYQGMLEFRINPRCASSFDLTCQAAVGLLGAVLQPVSTGPIATAHDTLPDPFDQSPHFDFPVERIDQNEIDFGDVHIGESVMLPITVANPGHSTLAVNPSDPSNPVFTVGAGACVPAMQMTQIPATFHPTHTGAFSATVTVDSNGIIGAPTIVTLVGNGVTSSTRPPGYHPPDGSGMFHRGDGSTEYHGPQIDAGCACNTAGARGTAGGGLWTAVGLVGVALGARRRRRPQA